MTIRTLVLSGGGGRGAFHAGVYKYLSETKKANVDPDHQDAWIPDVVVGTSIGALNGAAITQGVNAHELEAFWLSLREHDIQGLPPSMGILARRVINLFLKRSIGVPLPVVPKSKAMSPPADEAWPPIPIMPKWLANRLIGRWSNLLDTGPLHETLRNRLGIDEKKLSESEKTLLISATNIRTGEGMTFCNRQIYHKTTGDEHPAIKYGITLKRIVASCSIPIVYPWTTDDDGETYWDGALVANTPLSAAFEAVRDRSSHEPMEVVVVMMNPWREGDDHAQLPRLSKLPGDIGEAMTWTLDWTLLASFRVSLKMMRAFNKIAAYDIEAGREPSYRPVVDLIVAPDEFLPVERIIDYDEPASRRLIQLGYEAAQRAFQKRFGA